MAKEMKKKITFFIKLGEDFSFFSITGYLQKTRSVFSDARRVFNKSINMNDLLKTSQKKISRKPSKKLKFLEAT